VTDALPVEPLPAADVAFGEGIQGLGGQAVRRAHDRRGLYGPEQGAAVAVLERAGGEEVAGGLGLAEAEGGPRRGGGGGAARGRGGGPAGFAGGAGGGIKYRPVLSSGAFAMRRVLHAFLPPPPTLLGGVRRTAGFCEPPLNMTSEGGSPGRQARC